MNINLHIESIVLDGIDLSHNQMQQLQESVTGELRMMLLQAGLGGSCTSLGNRSQTEEGTIRLGGDQLGSAFGSQLAHAIYSRVAQPDRSVGASQGGRF